MLLTGKYLDDSRKDESLSLLESKQLKDEDKEADATQNCSQDHGSLDHLQVGWEEKRTLYSMLHGLKTHKDMALVTDCLTGSSGMAVDQGVAGGVTGEPQVGVE